MSRNNNNTNDNHATTTTIFLGCDSIEINLVFQNVDLNLPDCHHSHQPEKIMQSCVNIVFKCDPIKRGEFLGD